VVTPRLLQNRRRRPDCSVMLYLDPISCSTLRIGPIKPLGGQRPPHLATVSPYATSMSFVCANELASMDAGRASIADVSSGKPGRQVAFIANKATVAARFQAARTVRGTHPRSSRAQGRTCVRRRAHIASGGLSLSWSIAHLAQAVPSPVPSPVATPRPGGPPGGGGSGPSIDLGAILSALSPEHLFSNVLLLLSKQLAGALSRLWYDIWHSGFNILTYTDPGADVPVRTGRGSGNGHPTSSLPPSRRSAS